MAEVELFAQHQRQEGIKEGLRDGHKDGLRDGLRSAVVKFCKRAAIPLTEERTQSLQAMDAAALEQLYDYIIEHRAWPG